MTKVKSKLEVVKQTYLEVDYSDLERFIQEVYNRPDYEVTAAEEWGNDSCYDFKIYGDIEDDWDKENIRQFKNGGSCDLYVIMNDMCRNKVIKPGNYLVQVCW